MQEYRRSLVTDLCQGEPSSLSQIFFPCGCRAATNIHNYLILN